MSQMEVEIKIGGRSFEVACQQGEEQYLLSAAQLLDTEAQVLVTQIGRMPEARMLLMAGLMLADKTAGLEERLREAQDKLKAAESELAELKAKPAPDPEKVEVPVIPNDVTDALAEIAARAEALANSFDEAKSG
ncbi:cell division protein ZapA [Mameliella sediminis]|uniref:cell division protein ZapA n=1 Tax=Mameliella sediminis TaxID=2836866 RepID=UPI001C47FEE0|nr:cell division protein ZapA [Mameliella sediminis]MBY6114499.1 cell division protein ZapA [Antarctobacter heliothermus]MBY6144072.1 cell division protein ZapA [Mameliella alba]MBV7393020.1 cell division protein ZapA [Mameliella sediminis]MBY6161636.1 cell division protein ZapA [Mameliella alba]MBY6169898.1 cell division protein ZapA [Mameliella alba]